MNNGVPYDRQKRIEEEKGAEDPSVKQRLLHPICPIKDTLKQNKNKVKKMSCRKVQAGNTRWIMAKAKTQQTNCSIEQ